MTNLYNLRLYKESVWFSDLEDRYAQLGKSGDPLETLAVTVDFEPFRYRLNKALTRSDGSKGGRPSYDPVLMFKILILQALHSLSGEQAEFLIGDRCRFCGFSGSASTIRLPRPRRSG